MACKFHYSVFKGDDSAISTYHHVLASVIQGSRDTIKENEINVTVVFPDSALPTNTNGGFTTQAEFRNYVLEKHEDGKWDTTIHARPSSNRLADYTGEALAKAFPLVFPFGYSGCSEDPAIKTLQEMRKTKPFMNDQKNMYSRSICSIENLHFMVHYSS